ncbi:MAG TPA: glucose-6-phosphate dehydrogenase [Acidimicrobiales bacterium]|nr:glucose-6-phosphate dehydrogenase [Acidimicrobiales bacterium]
MSFASPEAVSPRPNPDGSAVIVVFGASGDLTSRKLLPALGLLTEHGSQRFGALIGVGRRPIADDEFAELVADRSGSSLGGAQVRYLAGDYADPDTYTRLGDLIEQLAGMPAYQADRVFYLATPPVTFATIAEGLGGSGLNAAKDGSYSRLLVEKPFGTDFESAAELERSLHNVFDESAIFRVDHYVAKEAVQNILALRFNPLLASAWDRTAIDHVQITVAEADGVAERASFYDHTGALRDIVQNHALQMLALLMMEPPASIDPDVIRAEKLKLLEVTRVPLDANDISAVAVRGQYTAGAGLAGYKDEHGVDPSSTTETYAAVRLDIDNERWAGVPVYVRTGKRLPRRVTELYVKFKPVDNHPFPGLSDTDALVVRVQPDDGVRLQLGVKASGEQFQLAPATMDFRLADRDDRTTDPYEQVFHDAITGNQRLFVSSDEVLQSWRIADPVVEAWATGGAPDAYPAGSWGPEAADKLIERDGRRWHEPAQ